MARFYGILQGNRGAATRMGTAGSGLTTHTAGWQGGIKVTLRDKNGRDYVRVEKVQWHGVGEFKVLYDGPVGDTTVELPELAEHDG